MDKQKCLEQMKDELRLRNYSPKTIKSYLSCLGKYIDFLVKNYKTVKELSVQEKVKKFLLTNLYLAVLFSSSFAQSSEILKVYLDKTKDNGQPVILNVKIQTEASISRAVFIEVPAGLNPVLHSAKLGDKALWLINSNKEITKDNVIGWYAEANGLVLHYTGSITKNNGLLEINLAPDSNRLERYDNFDVKIFPVSKSTQGLIVQKSMLAQSNLFVKKADME